MTTTSDDIKRQIDRQLKGDSAGQADDVQALFAEVAERFEVAHGILTSAPHYLDQPEDYEGFTTDNCDLMANLQNGSFYWNSRNNMIAWLVSRYFADARRVLDIGCGTGFVTSAMKAALPQAYFYGTDMFPRGLKYSTRAVDGKVFLFHMDARDIPFEGKFDLITSFDVLEHIETDQEVMEQTYRALKPGGGVLHVVPQHPRLWSPLDELACHQRRYTTTELQTKLENAGFRIEFDSSYMFFLVPLFALSRWKSRAFKQSDPSSEYNIPGWMSKTFDAVMAAELAMTKSGARWPVGVSRVVVARRD